MHVRGMLYLGILFVATAFFLGGIVFSSTFITGSTILHEHNYTITRAVCGTNGNCIDLIISCTNNHVVDITPVGELEEYRLGWEELTGIQEELCEQEAKT